MADALIILVLLLLGSLALRSCLKKKKEGSCSGGCGHCTGNCTGRNPQNKH